MSSCIFILNAPPLSFTKLDLYSTKFAFNTTGSFIKAISDTFFLSNEFRKQNLLYYCTEYNSKSFIVVFDGRTIKYLGPSFFSAAHLLLRAKNHINNPHSKKGKLTPGLDVYNTSFENILEKHADKKLVQIKESPKEKQISLSKSALLQPVFLLGFKDIPNKYNYSEISLGSLAIDEQIIVTNYFIDQVMENES